jgi:hypothetical protein
VHTLGHERVVDGDDVDALDTLRLELLDLLDEACTPSARIYAACSDGAHRGPGSSTVRRTRRGRRRSRSVRSSTSAARCKTKTRTLPVRWKSKGASGASSLTLIPAGIVPPGTTWAFASSEAAAECAAWVAEARIEVIVCV